MTVLLELKPEVEAAAQAEARTQGVSVERYLQSFLERTLPHMSSPLRDESVRQQRIEILARLQGKYAGLISSEEFADRKAEEKVREERHWISGE